jgi:hypothetical protein
MMKNTGSVYEDTLGGGGGKVGFSGGTKYSKSANCERWQIEIS